MDFSTRCLDYLQSHSCSEGEPLRLIELIKKHLPTSFSSIDWAAIPGQREVFDVGREELVGQLTLLVEGLGGGLKDVCVVINMDDAFPVLRTKISDWLAFSEELDFVDTIFLLESKGLIFHWDFKKSLHALRYGLL